MSNNHGWSPAQQARQEVRDTSGRYAEMGHAAGDVLADLDLDECREELSSALGALERLQLLREQGYVPAALGPAREGLSAKGWWEDKAAVAEVGVRPGDGPVEVHKMEPVRPDGRRVLRRTYEVAEGLEVQMPSVAAVREAVGRHGVVQIPFSADLDGRTPVQGWVQATRNRDGSFTVRTLGASGRSEAMMSMAVTNLLEGSRQTTSLASADELVAQADRRRAAEGNGMQLRPVVSSWIAEANYDERTQTSVWRAKDRDTLYTKQMPREVHDSVFQAARPGTELNIV